MGWSFSCLDIGRTEHIAQLTQPSAFSPGYTHLEHRVVGNHIWHLLRIEATGRVMISLTLIAKERGGGWGEKGISEDAGPCYYDCPLGLLNKATPPPADSYAVAWREKVREYHAKRTNKPKPAAGMVVTYGGQQYRLERPYAPRKGWLVTSTSSDGQFRMSARQLSSAERVEPQDVHECIA